jgi:predicted DNA-binding transcriptional regulator
MNKDQGIGVLLLIGSIVGVILYFWLLFLSGELLALLILKLTAFIALGFVLFILAWIGYTLATTPPPKPIEEIEKGLGKEAGEGEEEPPPPPSSS